MTGLFIKILRDVWLVTLLFGVALLLVMALLTYVLPHVQQGFDEVLDRIPFAKSMVAALLGTELGDELTARAMQAFLWVHPTVLALVWGLEIVLCTRVPAGEIDRGTIDFLLGLPISRRAVYLAESVVWLASGVFLLGMGLVGHRLTISAMPVELRPEWQQVALVMVNLFSVYLAVGGLALLASSLCSRRGVAMAIVFGIVLASFLLNFLAQFWEPAQHLAFLSVLQYYQPAEILSSGRLPLADVLTLLGVGGMSWLLGGIIFARRSISTV